MLNLNITQLGAKLFCWATFVKFQETVMVLVIAKCLKIEPKLRSFVSF